MSRYIDADFAHIKIRELIARERGKESEAVAWDALHIIENVPTADVVETPVRCKYCKHNVANWEHDELDATDYTDIVCDYWMSDGLEPDSFCSRGERITE